jgi:hypothetical protein
LFWRNPAQKSVNINRMETPFSVGIPRDDFPLTFVLPDFAHAAPGGSCQVAVSQTRKIGRHELAAYFVQLCAQLL